MSFRPVLLVSALLALFTASCAGAREATEKQLGELRAEFVRLRAENAVLSERVDNLELSRGAFSRGDRSRPSSGDAQAGGSGSDPDRPALDTVRLGPESAPPPNAPTGEAVAGDADDTDSNAPRPVVKLSGDSHGGDKSATASKKTPPGKANPKKKQQQP